MIPPGRHKNNFSATLNDFEVSTNVAVRQGDAFQASVKNVASFDDVINVVNEVGRIFSSQNFLFAYKKFKFKSKLRS
jgi:hypothetical protein